MRTYRIRWTERHEQVVEATNEDEAVDQAYQEDPSITLKSQTLEEIEFIKGYCKEHGVTLYEDTSCSSCSWEDIKIDTASGK